MAVCIRKLGTYGTWTVSSTRLDPPRPYPTRLDPLLPVSTRLDCLDPLRDEGRGKRQRTQGAGGGPSSGGRGGGNMGR